MSSNSERTFWEYLAEFSEKQSPLDFVLIWDHIDKFFYGALLTLEITAISLILGGAMCIPLAIARAYRHRWLNPPIWAFTYFFRGTPLLVQTYLIYYGLAQFDFIRESVLWEPILSKAWWCALIVFTLNTAAYTTEFLRGAIETTPFGEIEAARACGMSRVTMMRRVILPSAKFRQTLRLPRLAVSDDCVAHFGGYPFTDDNREQDHQQNQRNLSPSQRVDGSVKL